MSITQKALQRYLITKENIKIHYQTNEAFF